MPGLARTAIPAAVAGGSLLFGDDAEAGILRKAAQEYINYKPLAAGKGAGEFLSFGRDQKVIDRKIELLRQAMAPGEGGPSAKGYKTFQDFVHQKTNYDDWNKVAETIDGGYRGKNYKQGVDAFLEYIVERAPELEPQVNRYAKERFSSNHDQQMRKLDKIAIQKGQQPRPYNQRAPHERTMWIDKAKRSPGLLDEGMGFKTDPKAPGVDFEVVHPDAPEGYTFSHHASNKPIVRRTGGKGRQNAPREPETYIDPVTGRKKRKGPVGFSVGAPMMGQDYLEATMHNRDQKIAEHMDNLGLTKDSMYEYGSLLPMKSNIVTGERSLAAPDVLRDVMRGLLGLGMTPETGVYDPNNLLDVVL